MPENRCIGDFARCEPNKKRKEIEIKEGNRDYFVKKNAKIVQNGSLPENRFQEISLHLSSKTKKKLRVANLIKKEGKYDLADDGLFLLFFAMNK